jgi:hypothetical protein
MVAGVIDNILYCAGGYHGDKALLAVDAYYPSTDTWAAQAPIPTPRYSPAGGVLAGKLYVAGSGVGNIAIDRVEAYATKRP